MKKSIFTITLVAMLIIVGSAFGGNVNQKQYKQQNNADAQEQIKLIKWWLEEINDLERKVSRAERDSGQRYYNGGIVDNESDITVIRLRYKIGLNYVEVWALTKDKKYLEASVNSFRLAERYYINGANIKFQREQAGKLMELVYSRWADHIKWFEGPVKAQRFASDKAARLRQHQQFLSKTEEWLLPGD